MLCGFRNIRNYNFIFLILLAPCDISTYNLEATEYDKDSIITSDMHTMYTAMFKDVLVKPPNISTYTIMAMFSTTDLSLSEEVKVNSLNDFISSVGGNLGLFIGFSFLSLLLKLSDFMHSISIDNLFD